jgi:hypothetical protein
MKDRVVLVRPGALTRVMLCSPLLLLGCAVGGCDTRPESAPSDVPVGIKNMQENMKNQMKIQKGAKGQLKRGGQPLR